MKKLILFAIIFYVIIEQSGQQMIPCPGVDPKAPVQPVCVENQIRTVDRSAWKDKATATQVKNLLDKLKVSSRIEQGK